MKTKFILSALIMCTFLINTAQSQISYVVEIQNARNAKNQEFKKAGASPLTANQIQNFGSLSYFPIDSNARVRAIFTPANPQTEVSLATTAGTKVKLVKYGTVNFTYKNKNYTLSVFQNKDLPEFGKNSTQLFIPFSDPSNLNETNSKGRYLPITLPASGNSVTLDFNLAENPYNAYNKSYVSIIPPPGNEMLSAQTTGERKFEDRSN